MNRYTTPKLSKSNPKDWYVWFRLMRDSGDWSHPIKIRKGLNRFKSIKEREKFAKELELETLLKLKEESITERPKNLKPLSTLLDEMLELKQSSIRKRSYETYKYAVGVFKRFLKEHQGDFKGLDFADWLVRDGYTGRGFNNLITLNRILFNMLLDREIIEKNPLKKIPMQPQEDNKHMAFDSKQKERLKQYMLEHDRPLWDFVKFIYHLWVRPSEVLQVKIEDIDLQRRTVMIWGGVAKNRRQIPVDIPNSFIVEMKELNLENYPSGYYLFGYKFQRSEWSYSRNAATTRHSKVLKALKIPKEHTCYSWKHTGMCDTKEAGVDYYSIMRQARHHSLEETMTYFRSMGRIPNTGFKENAPKY